MDTVRLHAVFDGRDRSALGRLVRMGLGVASPFYRAGVQARNAAYERGWRAVVGLGRPTVSVGNLTAGGTGKTPMVIELVRRLAARGGRPAVLTRGYGADETVELGQALAAVGTGVVVEADADRVAAARRVLACDAAVDCFVLDDGFQHRRVARDLDLVLVDATNPFGYEHVLPRGLLREPMANLGRADGVIVTRADQVSEHERRYIDARVEKLTGKPAIAHAAHRWTSLLDADDAVLPMSHLGGLKVLGVCGIGNPASFARHLKEHAGSLAASRGAEKASPDALPGVLTRGDHHAYRHDELTEVLREAELRGAEAVVTTEKDWVKWRPLLAGHGLPVPVLRPVLAMRFLDGEGEVDTLLERLVSTAEPQMNTDGRG